MANPTHTLISSQTLGGTTASVTFSSIPTSYNDLKLVVSARGDAAGGTRVIVNMTFNGDSATNYSETWVGGNSSITFSGHLSSETSMTQSQIDIASATASAFGSWEIYIPNYNSTGSRPFFDISVVETNDTTANNTQIKAQAKLYRGASGITSIVLTPGSGNFVQYSNFYLYGIKNS